jgi:hypothetical protein
MGLEASVLAVSESLVPQVRFILQQRGVTCDQLPLGESDDPQTFLLKLLCSQDDGVVLLSVQREPHIHQDGPVIVLYPFPDSRKHRLISSRLMDTIAEILTENGAWALVHTPS